MFNKIYYLLFYSNPTFWLYIHICFENCSAYFLNLKLDDQGWVKIFLVCRNKTSRAWLDSGEMVKDFNQKNTYILVLVITLRHTVKSKLLFQMRQALAIYCFFLITFNVSTTVCCFKPGSENSGKLHQTIFRSDNLQETYRLQVK